MREFDFDELDKAVSSLMNKNQKNTNDQPSSDTSTDQPVSIDTPAATTPSETNDSPASDTATSEQPSTEVSSVTEAPVDSSSQETSSLDSEDDQTADSPDEKSEDISDSAARSVPHRAGNFMDVKHDSSNMRTSSPATGRHGITIQPMGSSAKADKSDETSKSKTDDSPDETVKTGDSEAPDMSVSPFLTDAKVEKRPLGRPGSALKADKSDDEESKADTPDADIPDEVETPAPTSADEPAELPEELQPDLVSIESDIDTTATEDTEDTKSRADKKPKVDIAGELEPETEHEAGSDSIEDAKPTGPVSIPQQYKESPSSQPQDSGTIYDTENYHQPITHPAKKSSGWTIVIWIVLIIILGCALGAAAYFSDLI